ncbi:hypothetical protein Tco_0751573 [Tanacetum coccineum]|uniref:Uncharacterized protein n=1 Tax=Tanacetum coccineum TaxID=301880 RepID=A0ABQ4Z7N3_9ASTR
MLGRKRARKEQQQESLKKQKVEKEKESDKVDEAELKKLLRFEVPRELSFDKDVQGIDREDLEALWRIVKAKLLKKKLEDSEDNISFRGGLLGLKRFMDSLEVNTDSGKSKEVRTPRYLSLVVPLKKVGDEAVHKELGDRMERAATTASSLEAEQDSDNILPHIIITQTHPSTSQQPPTPPFMQTIHDAEEPATMPYDLSQPRVQSLGNDKGSLTLNELTVLCTTLSKKVEDLQNDLKQTKLTYRAAYTKLILRVKKLEHKGRIITKINQNPSISLVQDEGTSWIQEDAETLWRTSADTEILLELEEPTELVEDPGSGEKGEKEISTAEVLVSTTSAIPEVSTAIPERQVYIRRSAKKRKGKGNAIMKDDEYVQKNTKKQLKQERLGHEEAIRLQNKEKFDKGQALELQKELDKRKEGVAETTQAHDIDWSNPANQRGYKQSHFKGMSYEDIRPIFERVCDQNQSFVPKDFEIENEVMKRSGFDFQKPPAKRQKVREVSGSIEEQSIGKEKEVSEEELKKLLMIVPVEEVYIEALQVYQLLEDMLKRFDRDDLEKLWDLVKKKFSSTEPTIDK